MVIFYKKWKKYNEIQLTKSKMDLNIQKMTNNPPASDKCVMSHVYMFICEAVQLTSKTF